MTLHDIPAFHNDALSLLAKALQESALPGEVADFDETARRDAATFLLETAGQRHPGTSIVALETLAGEGPHRRMRIAVINDDMPFLVDSVAAALTARQIDIHRILHPVVTAMRASDGRLEALTDEAGGKRRESMIYLEVDRVDAKSRRSLKTDLAGVLNDVRIAVADWTNVRQRVSETADALDYDEGAALLRWMLERHFTLLGHRVEQRFGPVGDCLGILRNRELPVWSEGTRVAAFTWFERGGRAPLILKSSTISTVHRQAPLELLVTPISDSGKLVGLSIIAGLWTSAALRAEPEQVPLLRKRLALLEATHRFNPAGHSGKALRHTLSALPRDVLLSVDEESLDTITVTAMSLADRPRPKLVVVPDPIRQHFHAFAWLPNEAVSRPRRQAITDLIERETLGHVRFCELDAGDGGLGLLRFIFDLPADADIPAPFALDAAFEAMMRGWEAALEIELTARVGGARATRLILEWGQRFPSSYRNRVEAAEAASDLLRMTALVDEDARETRLYRSIADKNPCRLRLKLYRRGALLPLSEAVPALENFGFVVLDQVPTRLEGADVFFVHEFVVETLDERAARGLIERSEAIEDAIVATLEGRGENDQFNALMTYAGLDQAGVTLFRAWFRYLRQTGAMFGLSTVADVLRRSPAIARTLIELFCALHDPRIASLATAEREETNLEEGLAEVAAIEDDRIIRLFRSVIMATLRTNAFAPAGASALAFKLDSKQLTGLPKPVPWREIWVYSPRVEGIHLRGGPIARGGLRWSDRRDDFRTEILGLMKAQVVKNAVIVPTGAKGGFYPKQLPSPLDREAFMAEGTTCYRTFIRALMSVTDNFVAGEVVHPPGVHRRDDDDPYLVVAADKGTATFSDIANDIALEQGFWLGDAFASGGSVGYDHKAMGITARGAWVSVQRHFAELGIDVQTYPIQVIGCGDMSGDVFGNGMLLSQSIRLIAAFDHRHIFLDPSSEPTSSYAERARLFALPRSSWDDYDRALISAGGGIFSRQQKSISLSAEIREMLGITADRLDPNALISAILRCKADLLWFGGIGTYVKAATETQAQVGDPANDILRVDADQVRARVIGEGANLGITQAGRIAFALKGGRLNTDFIDNSAGVDCSDNEVNIKIALKSALETGILSDGDRARVLADMTDNVAALVLVDNLDQTVALSCAEREGTDALPSQLRMIETLEATGRFDRVVDGIAASEELERRAEKGRGLTRPELAVLLAHAKLAIQHDIEISGLAEIDAYRQLLVDAFPERMGTQFADAILSHRLAPQIIATRISNRTVNRLGPSAPLEIAAAAKARPAQVALAYLAIEGLFGLDRIWNAIGTSIADQSEQFRRRAQIAHFSRRQTLDLLNSLPNGSTISAAADVYRPGVQRLLTTHQAIGEEADSIDDAIVRLETLDGAIGMAAPPCQRR